MFVRKVSCSTINVGKLWFSFFLCVINASSVESDLRSGYIQFLKNLVCICGVKIPGFLSLQFVAKKMP